MRHPYIIACLVAVAIVAVTMPSSTTLLGNIVASGIGLISGVTAALLAARGA